MRAHRSSQAVVQKFSATAEATCQTAAPTRSTAVQTDIKGLAKDGAPKYSKGTQTGTPEESRSRSQSRRRDEERIRRAERSPAATLEGPSSSRALRGQTAAGTASSPTIDTHPAHDAGTDSSVTGAEENEPPSTTARTAERNGGTAAPISPSGVIGDAGGIPGRGILIVPSHLLSESLRGFFLRPLPGPRIINFECDRYRSPAGVGREHRREQSRKRDRRSGTAAAMPKRGRIQTHPAPTTRGPTREKPRTANQQSW